MRPFTAIRKLNILGGNEAGISLIETLIALVILSFLAVGLLSGLSTIFRAGMIGQERVVAESLGKSQLDYIKDQDYITVADYDPDDPEKCYELIDISQGLVGGGYEIEILPPQTITLSAGSFKLQDVTVVIKRNGEEMFTISDYKVGVEF